MLNLWGMMGMKDWKRWAVLLLAWGSLGVSGASTVTYLAVMFGLVAWWLQNDIDHLKAKLQAIEEERLSLASRSPAGR